MACSSLFMALITEALFKAGRFTCILGGLHFPVLVIWQGVVVLVPWAT